MMAAAPRPLLFAVLDGDAPAAWKPWQADKPLADLLEPALKLVEPADDADAPAVEAISFEPMMQTLPELLASQRLHRVVGVMIDATRDPGDEAFYTEKIRQLERLCLHISRTTSPANLLIKQLSAFHVWFLVNDFDSQRWSKWEERSRDIVALKLSPKVEVYYVPMGPVLPMTAASFLKNTWYFLERSRLQ